MRINLLAADFSEQFKTYYLTYKDFIQYKLDGVGNKCVAEIKYLLELHYSVVDSL